MDRHRDRRYHFSTLPLRLHTSIEPSNDGADPPPSRSPERERARYPPPTDSYVPAANRSSRPRSRSPARYRPRSRSPPRMQADTWRGRPRSRSPSRRYEGRGDPYPLRDVRPRSPRRDYNSEPRFDQDARQPRARSPQALKRARESSPVVRGARSPPPIKRERVASPAREYVRPRSPSRRGYPSSPLPAVSRSEYRLRSRTPPRRDDRSDHNGLRSYRRRSPSPKVTKVELHSTEGSGRDSVATSRRSSPRPQARMLDAYVEPRINTTGFRSPRRTRSPLAISSTQRRAELAQLQAVSPLHQDMEGFDVRGQPADERNILPSDDQYPTIRDSRAPPPGPGYRDGRAPPTGPANSSRYGPASMVSTPHGPGGASVSMSAHNRPASTIPPSYSRTGGYRGRGGPSSTWDYQSREHHMSTSPTQGNRPAWVSTASYGRGRSPRDVAPTRDGNSYDPRPGPPPPRNRDFQQPPQPNFRGSGNNTSTTYPRTQRFNVQAVTSVHLSDLPPIKAGGEHLPQLYDTTKADRLEEEAARLRKLIDEKQEKKRHALREWDSLERQSKTAGLRTDLAEESLRGLSEEGSSLGVSGVAAF